MKMVLLSPPFAFLVYLLFVGILYLFGRLLAGKPNPNPLKASTYSSGEAPPRYNAAPGYRPFFVVALFFAILHLGVLVLGSGGLGGTAGVYLLGLVLALLALILG